VIVDLFERMRRDDLEQIVGVHDPATGLLGFIVIHDTTRGPGIGGCRLAPYPDADAALADGVRLAKAMTRKCALAGLAAGGAKGVFLDHPGITDRPAMLRALGRYVESLAGRFYTSGDLGIGPDELAHVRSASRYVAVPDDKTLDLAGAAATGVLAGMRATLRSAGKGGHLAGRTVAVQGLGAMGGRVAQMLLDAGATVFAAEPDPAHRAAFVGRVHFVEPEAIYDLEVDVLSPCAVGGVLTSERAARLKVTAVCGAANNQLADAEADAALWARGIWYAPDHAVNVGAVALGVAHFNDPFFDARSAIERVADRIEGTVLRIFDEVNTCGGAPGAVANRLADAALIRPRTTADQWWPIR
jgi:glutamate dehydrogenase/leucine dehydrogenase